MKETKVLALHSLLIAKVHKFPKIFSKLHWKNALNKMATTSC